jgi:hypothetical protein
VGAVDAASKGTAGGTVMSCSCPEPAVEEDIVSDPEITAALAYLNEQRLQRINDSIVLTPPPPLPTAAEVIAARTWGADHRPPLTPDEVRAAADIVERAAEPERPAGGPWQVRQLPARPVEGGSRGGTGSTSGTGTTSGRGSQGSTGAGRRVRPRVTSSFRPPRIFSTSSCGGCFASNPVPNRTWA